MAGIQRRKREARSNREGEQQRRKRPGERAHDSSEGGRRESVESRENGATGRREGQNELVVASASCNLLARTFM